MNADLNSHRIDPEAYARDLEPALARLTEQEQLSFALGCVSRVARFYRTFDGADLCVERAVRSIELWLTGTVDIARLEVLELKLDSAFARAMNAYDAADKWNNIYSASPAGVIAYQAQEAARSARDLLTAVKYSVQSERDEDENPTEYCANAAAGALAATLFDVEEIDCQNRLLSSDSR